MPEQREVYQNSQPPDAGASSSRTAANTGSTAGDRATSASTSGAASRTPKKARSTRNAKPTAEQALTVAQDIVRLFHDAGIVSFIVNTKSGDAAIVLGGVHYCETCRNLSIGAVCQKCESQK